ncbi:MAG TPA: polysaccharide biosynthesis protein [Parabacteroides sp.]|nr:polysaccharide biosynthesis protein [Parabacteroides sp.]
MANEHNSLKRIFHRASEEIYASRMIAKETSWGEGMNAFRAKLDTQVMNHNGYRESEAVKVHLLRKHEAVLRYLENRFGDYYASYDYDASLPPVALDKRNKIWMCWWQGLDTAPEIVKACIESVRRNAGGREVIVINDENVEEYVQFPNWIKELHKNGILSRTHISDLLRLELLAQYGGIWLDSTFYCCRPLTSTVYSAPLWSIKRPDYLHASVASGMFANYSFGCDEKHRKIFAVIRDYFLEYWRKENYLVDYLLTDYLIVLAQRHSSWIAEAFDEIQPNNPQCDELFKILDQPYDENRWEELSAHTDLFKLTWKQIFPKKVNEVPSFYGKMIH